MAALLWDIQGDDSQQTKEPEELSVFGYACKLFRDDHKALSIDEGEHLIPWMGDTSLMIDRYDGRGHLFDLSTYDSSRVKASELSEDEQQIEALCDEERYLELKHDMAEKKMYEEEEWKRYYQSLSEGFNAVGFSYDYQHQQDYMQTAEAAAASEQETAFEVPEELQVPPDIAVPDTEKQHAIIEKTAKFIAGHGMQMEIIIKTKQAKNPQFDFLHFEDPLNQYYKHMVSMIKSGKYKPKEAKEEEEDDAKDEPHSHHGYLHPSLVKPTTVTSNPILNIAPAVKMPAVSIHDTPYGKLIRKFKKTIPEAERNSNSPQPGDSGSYSPHSQSNTPPPSDAPISVDYHHGAPGVPPPPGLEPVTLPASNQPPPPGTEPVGPLLPPHLQQQVLKQEEVVEEKPQSVAPPQLIGPSLEPKIIPPPPDIQPIIDRMAMYVAKNGVEFEIVVRSKKDPRFEFLQPWHSYFRYYNSKKKIFIEEVMKEREKLEQEKPAKLSFSIKNKTKEQDGSTKRKKKKKLFDHDSSGEEEADGLTKSGTSTPIDGELSRTSSDDKLPEISEKKLAEEKLKDKLAQAARDKMSKASREKQIQAERKRKAAMFINMLKSAKGSTDDGRGNSTPGGSRSHTPSSFDEEPESKKVKKSRSKHSRSRSRSPRTKSRRSRSRSRSPRKQRSPTPSAYIKRSESRSPSRIKSVRSSRSPSGYKRSRSPSLKRSDSPVKPKKSKKKKRTKSRSPSRKSKSTKVYDDSLDDSIPERLSASPLTTSNMSSRISQPVADDDSNSTMSTDSSKNVSNYMLSRVRALIKASREAVKKEDIFDDT